VSAVLNTPSDRLALSRERLRHAMRTSAAPKGGSTHPHAGRFSTAWLASLKDIPGAAVIISAVTSWWAQHPLRLAGMVAADAASAVVRPVAQRNPLGLVLGALVLGGVLAWSRPWRWLLTPALFAGLLPQLFSKAMALVPPSSWMAVLTSLVQQQERAPAAPPPGGQQAQASVH
jgi:hypothetical protein